MSKDREIRAARKAKQRLRQQAYKGVSTWSNPTKDLLPKKSKNCRED